ncbi:MarR family winged helix-turn-helix transcriptional regulator [Allosphingosinicella deserti]|uniref:MarR family transcriptional regulator n=1 Tax=Allosphingosinicella deserti TaxID=2116704 RepID=A0A2P7QIS7_9SPHN|nr:MarR family transcriptional regulator [Sphingomonas deserti]PSJ37885.1 MarR family transcriptional regulator [Sphingomonas deserti]
MPSNSLNAQFDSAGRAASEAMVDFDRRMAERLGLGYNDYRCLDLLLARGAMQAGELARAIGFTTGAVTGIVDRLVRAGFVERAVDSADLRRVVVTPVAAAANARVWPRLHNLDRRLEELHRSYSDKERAVLLDYLARLAEAMRIEAEAL